MAYKKCLIATTKNLFDSNNIDSTYLGVSYKTIGNGRIKLNGNRQDGTNAYSVTTPNITLPAGTYTLSCKFISGSIENPSDDFNRYIYFGINKSSYTLRTEGVGYIGDYETKSFTLTEDTLLTSFDITAGYTSGFAIDNVVIECQLEKGSTATSYVPYGYLPSYKKIIKVNNVCQILNKSKFPATQTINGITFTNNGDGTIVVNGTANAEAQLDFVSHLGTTLAFSGLDASSKLMFSGCPAGGSNSTYGIQNTWVSASFIDSGNGGITYTTFTKYDGYYRFGYAIVIKQGYTANNLVFKPMCINLTEMYGAGHEPSTVVEFRQKFPNDYYDYSPSCWITSYQKNLITDGSSKNLFDIPLTQGYPSDKNYGASTKRTFTIGTYITGFARNNYYNPDNITNVNVSKGIISFKVVNASGYGIGIPILLTAGQTYTASCLVDNNVRPGIGISYYKEDGTPISYTQVEMVTNNPIVSFTIPEGTYFTVVVLYGQSNNNYVFSNIQLEKGNTVTSYVPYQYL